MTEGISGVLTGVSGEYFVAAELSRRGFIASITLRNTKGIDVLAPNQDTSKSVGIQVKTNHGKRKAWILNQKAENYFEENLFYIFVNLKGTNERPDFYIVPSKVVAEHIKKSHQEWLKTPGKKGKPHKDTPMRMFKDEEDQYLEKWGSLGL
ncbi:MAG: hypothetical protein U9O85_02700 [Euryarchaeota archaeon]|nr:hypothetical protein [Euryarchaeota archaeon]